MWIPFLHFWMGSSIKLRGYLSKNTKNPHTELKKELLGCRPSGQQEVRSWEKCLKMKWLK